MPVLVQLSDLHFGRHDPDLVRPLSEAVRNLHPDILAVSGDLTQHATGSEFVQCRDFLQGLPGFPIVVPGNHDLSFYNPVRRVFQRLAVYKQYITRDFEPMYRDGEISVLGLNTARVPLFRAGHFSRGQLRKVEEHMRAARGVRILVTHHPFDHVHPGLSRLLGSVDVLLAGHLHASHSEARAMRYKSEGRSGIFIQAGTALSLRRPGEPNSFNVLRIGPDSVALEIWRVAGGRYAESAYVAFHRTPDGWSAPAAPAAK